MIRPTLTLLAAISLLAAAAPAPTDPTPTPAVVEVKLIDISATQFGFSPAKITVKRGDTVRFTQTKVNGHNVEFKTFPAGVDLGAARMGPFLMTPDAVYEIKIDERFKPGTYDIVCTPHEMMGMKAQIIVTN